MKAKVVSGLLLLVGVLNLTPAIVFFDLSRTESLYGIHIANDDAGIIVRHRAVLLGLLGAAMIFAAFKREFVVPAITAAFLGKLAFLYLIWTTVNTIELDRVAIFDIAAIVVLLIALVLHLTSPKK